MAVLQRLGRHPTALRAFLTYSLVWLIYLFYPVSALFASHDAPWQFLVTLSCLTAFLVLYVAYWLQPFQRTDLQRCVTCGATVLLGVVMVEVTGSVLWSALLIYAVAGFSLVESRRIYWLGGLGLTLVAVGLDLTTHAGLGLLSWFGLPFVSMLVGMRAIWQFTRLHRMLAKAQAEIEELATSNERLRIGRDLHDLLGHSLSALALRADLARSHLHRGQTEGADAELEQIAKMARDALQEVRQVVTAYRETHFLTEQEQAQRLLSDVGIVVYAHGLNCAFDFQAQPRQDRVLAFALREGITNVLRHGSAHQVWITLQSQDQAVFLTLEDDGPGPASETPTAGNAAVVAGHGLRGIEERVRELGGRMEAGASPHGGFRLHLEIPFSEGIA